MNFSFQALTNQWWMVIGLAIVKRKHVIVPSLLCRAKLPNKVETPTNWQSPEGDTVDCGTDLDW